MRQGGGTPQNLMGGLSQNMGGAWGELKMLSKIPVKEFDSKVASCAISLHTVVMAGNGTF